MNLLLETTTYPHCQDLEELKTEILHCDLCSLNRSRTEHGLWKLPGLGHPQANVIFVAEAPSATGGCREGLYYSTSNSIFYWYLKQAGFQIPIDRATVAALGRLSKQEKKLEIMSGVRQPPVTIKNLANLSRGSNLTPLEIQSEVQHIRETRHHIMQPIYESFVQELLYASDIVRCPSYNPELDANSRLPKDSIEKCLDFLLRELQIVKPKIVCTMGTVALKVLTGWASLEAARDKRIIKGSECSVAHGIDVLPTYFPTAMRPDRSKIEDLTFLRQYLGI